MALHLYIDERPIAKVCWRFSYPTPSAGRRWTSCIFYLSSYPLTVVVPQVLHAFATLNRVERGAGLWAWRFQWHRKADHVCRLQSASCSERVWHPPVRGTTGAPGKTPTQMLRLLGTKSILSFWSKRFSSPSCYPSWSVLWFLDLKEGVSSLMYTILTCCILVQIENHVELPPGSEQEVEIRASSIIAIEKFSEALQKNFGTKLHSIQLDWWLWEQGERMRKQHPPHHRSQTIFYWFISHKYGEYCGQNFQISFACKYGNLNFVNSLSRPVLVLKIHSFGELIAYYSNCCFCGEVSSLRWCGKNYFMGQNSYHTKNKVGSGQYWDVTSVLQRVDMYGTLQYLFWK